MSGFPRLLPGIRKAVRIRREIAYETVNAFAAGAASHEDVEEAFAKLEEAKDEARKLAAGGER